MRWSVDIGDISTLNSFITGGISVVLNVTLIIVIYNRSLKAIGAYKYLMITVTLLDILLSVTYILASPVCQSMFFVAKIWS
uniref:G_PROTEIN_RECEP_F1_2 domain-containing protein n=1 Tax=Heterorhabditis bacteriophora TaxID=37862 RepID=A0A1I7WI96_HETBA